MSVDVTISELRRMLVRIARILDLAGLEAMDEIEIAYFRSRK